MLCDHTVGRVNAQAVAACSPWKSAHLVIDELLAAKAGVHRHDQDQVCT